MGCVAGEIKRHDIDLFVAGWVSQEANPKIEFKMEDVYYGAHLVSIPMRVWKAGVGRGRSQAVMWSSKTAC